MIVWFIIHYSWFKRCFNTIALWIPEVSLIMSDPSPNKSRHYTFNLAKPNFDSSSLPRLNIRHTAGMSFNGGCKTNWQILVSSWRISQLWRQQTLAKISQDTWLVSPARQVFMSLLHVGCHWPSPHHLDVTGCILTRGYPVPGTKKGCQMKEAIYAPIYGDCGMKLNQINNLWTLTHSLNSCLILNEHRLTMIDQHFLIWVNQGNFSSLRMCRLFFRWSADPAWSTYNRPLWM